MNCSIRCKRAIKSSAALANAFRNVSLILAYQYAHVFNLYNSLSDPSIDSPTPSPLINKQDLPLPLEILQS
jgi:hypothetical protein